MFSCLYVLKINSNHLKRLAKLNIDKTSPNHLLKLFNKQTKWKAPPTCLRALANASMATASLPGVRIASWDTALAMTISEQPAN